MGDYLAISISDETYYHWRESKAFVPFSIVFYEESGFIPHNHAILSRMHGVPNSSFLVLRPSKIIFGDWVAKDTFFVKVI